jgi:hypothetical protein
MCNSLAGVNKKHGFIRYKQITVIKEGVFRLESYTYLYKTRYPLVKFHRHNMKEVALKQRHRKLQINTAGICVYFSDGFLMRPLYPKAVFPLPFLLM